MKTASEHRAEHAIRLLIGILERNIEDSGKILDELERTHDDSELGESRLYNALLTGHFGLSETLEKINNQLNK